MLVSLLFLLFQTSCNNNKPFFSEKDVDFCDWQERGNLSFSISPVLLFVEYIESLQDSGWQTVTSPTMSGTAEFAVTFDSGKFIGWTTGSMTTCPFTVKDKNNVNYDGSASASAGIAKDGNPTKESIGGHVYLRQTYKMTISVALTCNGWTSQYSKTGTCFSDKLLK